MLPQVGHLSEPTAGTDAGVSGFSGPFAASHGCCSFKNVTTIFAQCYI